MKKTLLYIDGQNFLHKVEEVIGHESSKKGLADAVNIDFTKLFTDTLKGYTISEIIFYGAKLHHNPETPKKSEELIKAQRKLINNLKKHGITFIMAGNVRGQKVGSKMIFKEKGVDVRIAVDLVANACDSNLEKAIICSSDSDLQPAIAEIKKRKVEVIYLGFEIAPNKGLTFTTDRTILFRNSEIVDALTIPIK